MLERRRFTVPELVCTKSVAATLRRTGFPHRHGRNSLSTTRAGFTLLELLVVCVIAAVIIAISGKGLASAYAGNARSSATRMVSTTLFQARALAIQRSRRSWLVRSGSTIKILGDSLGTNVQLGQTLDLARRYNVTLTSVATPTPTDTSISFDSRGLITGTTTSLKIVVTKGSGSDTVCVTGLGNTRARGC